MSLSPNQEFLFTRQRHEADKMGLHWDYRFVVGDKAYSFATKKEMPDPGKAILLFEQPVHDSTYALSERVEIPKGQYGAGVTTLDFVHKARIGENSTKDQLTLYVKNGQKFLLKRMPDTKYGDKAWLFRNLTKPETEMSSNRYLEKIAQSYDFNSEVQRLGGVSRADLQKARQASAVAANHNSKVYDEALDQAYAAVEDKHFKSELDWHQAVDRKFKASYPKLKTVPEAMPRPQLEARKRNGTAAEVASWTGGAIGGMATGLAAGIGVERLAKGRLNGYGAQALGLAGTFAGGALANKGVEHLRFGKHNRGVDERNTPKVNSYVQDLRDKGFLAK